MSNARRISMMFYGSKFDGDVSNWDVRNVTHAEGLFEGSPFNGDVSRWNTQRLINAMGMFCKTPFSGDVSNWNMSQVMSLHGMFAHSPFNGDISKWNVTNVRGFGQLFAHSLFSGDISKWCVSPEPTIFEGMLAGNTAFAGDLSAWPISYSSHVAGMLEPHFKGVLPTKPEFEHAPAYYSAFFKNEEAFDQYLRQQPFCQAHADVLSCCHIRPGWLKEEDYAKVKHVLDIAIGLYMSSKEVGVCILQAHRANGRPPVESMFPIDDLLDI